MMNPSTDLRHAGRTVPQPDAKVRLTVQGVSRGLLNLSADGIGMLIDSPNKFHLGQRITDIRIEMEGKSHRFQGAVAHITRTINGLVVGIHLEFNSIDAYRFIEQVKKRCVPDSDPNKKE